MTGWAWTYDSTRPTIANPHFMPPLATERWPYAASWLSTWASPAFSTLSPLDSYLCSTSKFGRRRSKILYATFCKRDENAVNWAEFRSCDNAKNTQFYLVALFRLLEITFPEQRRSAQLNHSALEIDRPHQCTLSECRRLHVYLEQIGPNWRDLRGQMAFSLY